MSPDMGETTEGKAEALCRHVPDWYVRLCHVSTIVGDYRTHPCTVIAATLMHQEYTTLRALLFHRFVMFQC